MLDKHKVNYKIYEYEQLTNGEEIAIRLGENPNQVFKTLVTVAKSGQHYVFMLPVNQELDLKKAALAVKEKSVEMVKSKELLPLTGYIHGGCSPIGMKKQFKTVIHKTASEFPKIIFSGGRIGLQVEMPLAALLQVVPVVQADIILEKRG